MREASSSEVTELDASAAELPRYGVVVLTQGARPADLARGLASLQAQRGVDLDVVRLKGLPA